MGSPITITADSLFNACTSTTGFSNLGGFNAPSLVSRTLPTVLGGGTQNCVTWTGTAANTNGFGILPAPGATDTKRGISFWFYADLSAFGPDRGASNFGYIRLRSAGQTHQLEAYVSVRHGWNHVQLGRQDFAVATGTPTWSTTWADMLLKISGVSGVTHSVSVANLSWLGLNRSQVCFCFDDGLNTTRTVYKPILDQYGWKSTTGVIGSQVGVVTGKMSLAQLHTLHDDGWAMVNHSYLHSPNPFLLSATQAQCYDEIMNGQNYLVTNGFTRNDEHLDFWSPYGEATANYLAGARQAGCRSFRGRYGDNNPLWATPSNSSVAGIDDWPNCCVNISDNTVISDVKANFKNAVLAGRPCAILAHTSDHVADNVSAGIEVTEAKMRDLCAFMYEYQALFDMVTWPEMMIRLRDAAS